jgi:hypothetical protein
VLAVALAVDDPGPVGTPTALGEEVTTAGATGLEELPGADAGGNAVSLPAVSVVVPGVTAASAESAVSFPQPPARARQSAKPSIERLVLRFQIHSLP